MSSASSATSFGSGTSTAISSPARTTCERLAGPPFTRTEPSAISFCRRERDMSEQAAARKRSRRVPADGAPTRNRRITGSGLGAMPTREVEEHAAGDGGRDEADRLRGREDAGNHEASDEVSAPGLEDAARDRIEEHVEPEDFAVERPA